MLQRVSGQYPHMLTDVDGCGRLPRTGDSGNFLAFGTM